MCLILFAYHRHPEYPLVLVANRDEYYQRPTRPAHWWSERPDLLAGQDLEAGGTWLGITRRGRLAAVTNVREPHLAAPGSCSRGLLTRRYLEEGVGDQHFCGLLQETWDQYRGYNLIFGSLGALYYFSNRGNAPQRLSSGIYGLSNARLDTPWPKVQQGKALLQKQLEKPRQDTAELLDILSSTGIAADAQLPATGVSLELERRLSAIRITGPDYGTRSSTVLVIDRRGQVHFHEKPLAPEPGQGIRITFHLEE
jgi:uncharacterized protein with NRDE domain